MINPALTEELLRYSVRAWNAAQVDGYTANLYRADLTGPTSAGPTSARPTPTGPTSAGPTSAWPTSTGPTSTWPTSAGPTSAGPTSAGPTSAGPTSARPTSAGPTSARPTSAGPTSAGPTSAGPTSSGADLRGADLSGAYWGVSIPTVPHLDAAILDAIGEDPTRLNMRNWHTCETTHCRAGWAVTLAGDAGRALEAKTSPYLAGRLIYEASRPGVPCPDFFASDDDALADITRCASV
jgi:hypothetical protein